MCVCVDLISAVITSVAANDLRDTWSLIYAGRNITKQEIMNSFCLMPDV